MLRSDAQWGRRPPARALRLADNDGIGEFVTKGFLDSILRGPLGLVAVGAN